MIKTGRRKNEKGKRKCKGEDRQSKNMRKIASKKPFKHFLCTLSLFLI